MEKLLVVEDAQDLRNQLKSELGREYAILEGMDRADAMELFLKYCPKVVAIDLGLPPDPEGSSEGLRCLEWMIGMRPATKVVVLTSPGERENAYRALRCGAYDFHQKPVVPAELQVIIRRAFHLYSLEEQSCELRQALRRTTAGIEGIAGQCVALQRLFSPGQAIAPGAPEPAAGVGNSASRLTLREARDRVEKRMVSDAIGNCGGNLSKASELLGVSRPALYDLMKKYGICRSVARS